MDLLRVQVQERQKVECKEAEAGVAREAHEKKEQEKEHLCLEKARTQHKALEIVEKVAGQTKE
jgi:hypothetical protein